MKTKRPVQSKCKLITNIISNRALNRIAVKSGFKKRAYKKISPLSIIGSYLNFISNGKFSFSAWAVELSSMISCTVSKQGIYKRMTPLLVNYLKMVLESIVSGQILSKSLLKTRHFSDFKNVYLHDATSFSLPLHLVHRFPGHFSSGAKAVAKIQTVFNLTKRCFSFFELTGYTCADIKSTPVVNQKLKAGDLIIRDLGYFAIHCFEQVMQADAFFLSRFKHNVAVREIQNAAPVNLMKILRKNNTIDVQVWLSSLMPLPVRLVAVELPSSIANARRRKARKDNRSPKLNHSKAYYFLLGYAIYITNVPVAIWSVQQISEAYKCRWYIETIFKSWKSNLNARYTDCERYANELTVETHFYLLMIYVCIIIMPLLTLIEKHCHKRKLKVQISLLKLTSFIASSLHQLMNNLIYKPLIERIIYYVKYDKRSDYKNFNDHFLLILS